MKFLVPTDFSKLSNTASHYAARMANKLKAEVVLIHAVSFNGPPRAQASFHLKEIEDKMADNARQDCIHLANTLTTEYGAPGVSYEIIKGHPVEDVIDNYAAHNGIDYIIMGTKGATGLQKVLLGSNAAAVVNGSSVPVLIIPEHARFNDIRKIVYASDTVEIEPELEQLMKFARLFGAAVDMVHVLPPGSDKKIDSTQIKADIQRKFNDPTLAVHVILNDDILEGIDEFVADQKADMLAMFTRRRSFFEKLFGKSITRQMAFHAWIPMIALKK